MTRKPSKKRTQKTDTEPEVLGDDTHDGEREPLLDALEDLLIGADDCTLSARLAIQETFGGKCDAAREAEVLKMVKGDCRFRIIAGSGGAPNRIALAPLNAQDDAAATAAMLDAAKATAESPVNNPTADSTADPAQQTLGEMVEAQKGKPQRIPWPHDVGSSVLLLTDGYPPDKAIIRNIHDNGSYALYDLSATNGGETLGVPAHRIGRDIDAEGEMASMRLRMSALERHIAKGATLAQQIVLKQADERTKSEELSKLRKEIDELYGKLAEHDRSEPGQTDIRDVVGDGSEGSQAAPEYTGSGTTEAPTVAKRLEVGDVIDLDDCPFDANSLVAARFDRWSASTGKPAQVKPVSYQEDEYLLVDVQKGVAVLLPVVNQAGWSARFLDRFGEVLELPSDVQSAKLEAGGKLCGVPVRAGRRKLWIAPESDALLLALPPEMHGVCEPEPQAAVSGKDAAAGG